jgi:hypothetical protein
MVVALEDFGRDHFSLLMYLESCVVDNPVPKMKNTGRYALERLRCNPDRRPHKLGNRGARWLPTHGTRLFGFKEGIRDRQLPEHDDHDCLEDLEAAGMVSTLPADAISLTPYGLAVAAKLREWKAAQQPLGMFKAPAPKSVAYDLATHPVVRQWQEVSLALFSRVETHFSPGEHVAIRRVIYEGLPKLFAAAGEKHVSVSKDNWWNRMQAAACELDDPTTLQPILDLTATIEDSDWQAVGPREVGASDEPGGDGSGTQGQPAAHKVG